MMVTSTSCVHFLNIELLSPLRRWENWGKAQVSYLSKVIRVVCSENRAETQVQTPTCCSIPSSPGALTPSSPLAPRDLINPPTLPRNRLHLAQLFSGTSPGLSAVLLREKKGGFRYRALKFCVTAQLGHFWDKKFKLHSCLGNQRTQLQVGGSLPCREETGVPR